jgi:D-alanyl-D-alanine carboxypeptidase/D-alanyl-D-alanine-endopeptidase (penicillin-binding protein 4)
MSGVNLLAILLIFGFSVPALSNSSFASPADWSQPTENETSERDTSELDVGASESLQRSWPLNYLNYLDWNQVFSAPPYSSINWGLGWDIAGGYSKQSDQLFAPASVLKLITAAAAIQNLGPQFRFETYFAGSLDVQTGILQNPEWITSGDPTLGHEAYGESIRSRFDKMASALKAQGVKTIIGPLTLAHRKPELETFSRPKDWRNTWDIKCFATLLTPVIINGNCAQLAIFPNGSTRWKTEGVAVPLVKRFATSGTKKIKVDAVKDSLGRVVRYVLTGSLPTQVQTVSLPVHDSANWLNRLWVAAIKRKGIVLVNSVAGKKLIAKKHLKTIPLSIDLSSQTLLKILTPMVQDSINVTADRLMLEVNAVQFLKQHVDRHELFEGLRVHDGSGLGLENKIKPALVYEFLKTAIGRPYFSDWISTFAVAGKSGTIQNRMKDPVTQGSVFAKTGSLEGIANLAGYYQAPDQRFFPFVIFAKFDPRIQTARRLTDEVVIRLARAHLGN